MCRLGFAGMALEARKPKVHVRCAKCPIIRIFIDHRIMLSLDTFVALFSLQHA